MSFEKVYKKAQEIVPQPNLGVSGGMLSEMPIPAFSARHFQ